MINRARTLAVIVVGTLLAGCGGAAAARRASPAAPVPLGVTVLAGQVEPWVSDRAAVTPTAIGRDETAFGFALFRRLCAAAPAANLTLSPASVAEAVGMLDAGAVGATQTRLAAMFDFPAWTPAVVGALHRQAAALSQLQQVTVSNHLFEQAGVTPSRRALDDLKTAYDADLRQVNFADEPAATNAINAAVRHDTLAMIPALFGHPLDASTRVVLTDAIVLDALWADPFTAPQPGTFHTASGRAVSAPLMSSSDTGFAARSAAGWQSVVLPYAGHHLQAVALLPPTSAASCATPPATTMAALTTGMSEPAGVVLPTVSLAQTHSLQATLAALGMPASGDYSGLGAGDSEISQVVQKVVMRVDRHGTKAAAATGVVDTTAIRYRPTIVTLNRPFLLMLEDTATHTPLFLTRVADPTAG